MPRLSTQHNSQSGITLLEILVVLSIMSLSLLVIAPNFKGPLAKMSFEQEVQRFVSTLETARSQAIRRNEAVDVLINADLKTYSDSIYNTSKTLPNDTEITITAAATDITDDTAVITFYPDGSAKGADVQLTRQAQSYHISVDWLLGDIQMERARNAQ